MPGISITSPRIYLSMETGELALRQGVNPNMKSRADTRVLIIGGGVTGLTVSCSLVYYDSLKLTYFA